MATSSSIPTTFSVAPVVETVVIAWRKEEEDKKGKVKKSHFFKQMWVVLERENKFFFGRK